MQNEVLWILTNVKKIISKEVFFQVFPGAVAQKPTAVVQGIFSSVKKVPGISRTFPAFHPDLDITNHQRII